MSRISYLVSCVFFLVSCFFCLSATCSNLSQQNNTTPLARVSNACLNNSPLARVSNSCLNDSLKPNNIFPEFRLNYGFIIRHHKDIAHLTNTHFPAYELNLVRQTSGTKYWQQRFAYPQIGISFLYTSLGNNPFVGNAYSLTPYINFPLYKAPRFRFCYRFGVGLSWLTKKFDAVNDYKNISISTDINASIRTDFEADWYIHRFILSSGIGLSHYSNGGFRQPNLGFNIAALSLGIAYQLKTTDSPLERGQRGVLQPAPNSQLPTQNSTLPTPSSQIPAPNSPLPTPYSPLPTPNSTLPTPSSLLPAPYSQLPTPSFLLIAYAGSKGIFPPGSKNYAIYNIEAGYLKRIGYKSEIGAGVNLVYDFSLPALQKHIGDTIAQGLKVFQPGIYLAYQLDISKLKLQFNIGTYLYSVYTQNGSLFERLILIYPVSKKVFVNLSLKTYYFKADVSQFGLGYRIN